MKRLLLLAALCVLLAAIPANTQNTIDFGELYHRWTNPQNGLSYASAVVDTTNFHAPAGSIIRAVVPDRNSTKEYAGRVNFRTTGRDSNIIEAGSTVYHNAELRFIGPTRIGSPGGPPVKFIPTSMRSHPSLQTSGGYNKTIDRNAGIVVVGDFVGYNLEITGLTEGGGIKAAYGSTVVICDSRTQNLSTVQAPFVEGNDLPKSGDIRIKTVRHKFDDTERYLNFDADKGVIYEDEGSFIGEKDLGIRFSAIPFNDPTQTSAYLATYGKYSATFNRSTSREPIDKRILRPYQLPGDEAPIVEMLNRIIGARVIILSGSTPASPDFNGSGVVDFDDFFLFADSFGQLATGDNAKFDLNGSGGSIDFDDFFAFADKFGTTSSGKMAARKPVVPTPEQLSRLLAIASQSQEWRQAVERLLPANVLPRRFQLAQNFPNPFNPATTIGYTLPEAAEVNLVIYSLTGQVVRTLVATKQLAGRYEVNWNGTDDSGRRVATGIYIYQLTAASHVERRRMLLIK